MSSNIFLIIALITTGIFVIQFILSIFFGDIDTEIDIDADISSVVSFKGLTHFGIGFGWYMYLAGHTDVANYIIGILISLPNSLANKNALFGPIRFPPRSIILYIAQFKISSL